MIRILSLFLLLISHSAFCDVALSVRPIPLSFPIPTVEDLNRGYMTRGAFRTTQGLVVRVRSEDTTPWRLTMRSRDSHFAPPSLRKPVNHLQWKLNEDDINEYRDLTLYEQTVFSSTRGGNEDIRIDLVLITQWADPPAAYSLDLLFTVHLE